MQPPDELMMSEFLPAMRHLVAGRLRAGGLSQSRISALLGITQASVSLYLSRDSRKAYSSLARFSVTQGQADRYANQLAAEAGRSAVVAVGALHDIWTDLLGSGSVCQAHRALYPSLADCDVCIKEYGRRKGERTEAISEVTEAVRMLEASPTFVVVMPEVSVNIACAAGDAQSPADVVAVPGRIVKVKNRAKAMLPPEAGASVHMSRVLLLVRGKNPRIRACLNLRYDDKMAAAMRKAGLRTLRIGGYPTAGVTDPTAEAIERALKRSPVSFDAVVDEGESGIEPNVYLFAAGAKEVAELALRLARAYSAA